MSNTRKCLGCGGPVKKRKFWCDKCVKRNMDHGVVSQRIVPIEADIQWLAERSPTSNRFIAVCETMNLSMEADSIDELHKLVYETMQLVFLDLLQDNDLDSYLEERGWNASGLTSGVTSETKFSFPWTLTVRTIGDSAPSSNKEGKPHD